MNDDRNYPARTVPLLALILALLAVFPGGIQAASPGGERARQILAEIDDLWRADSSAATVSMRVVTANYSRAVTMESWSLGKDKSLVRIIAPLKEKGTATLKSGSAIYTYLPKTDRTIRLTSSMMSGSWMGSHFTNDDLVKESRLADDYDPEITFEGVREGRKIIEFALTPRPEAPVVWGRIVTTVLADGYLPLFSSYYDEDGRLARTINFTDLKVMGGRRLPAVMHVVPADKPGEYTELVYEKISFGQPLTEAFFSLQEIRRR
jgi:outer membrane lipoprotein-sorting protein